MKKIAPKDIRLIKLGRAGKWEKSSLEKDQVIRLGYVSPHHEQCLVGDWKPVEAHWRNVREGKVGPAKSDIRQIRDFYEQPSTTLWITFYARQLWWCFADEEVRRLEDGTRVRSVRGAWHNTDIQGDALRVETLDGRLTRVGMYRGTICDVKPAVGQYLVRRINGERAPEVREAEDALTSLNDAVKKLIKGLHWKDFELFTDLLFTRAGYQRVDVAGGTAKAIDLDMFAPVTGRSAFVQVKSQASLQTLEKCITQFEEASTHDEFFFVCHTGKELEGFEPEQSNVRVLTADSLADVAIQAGLVSWLIAKRS